jgi:hypothetical protein
MPKLVILEKRPIKKAKMPRACSEATKTANRANAKISKLKKQERMKQLRAEHERLLRRHADVSMEASEVDMKTKELLTQLTTMRTIVTSQKEEETRRKMVNNN